MKRVKKHSLYWGVLLVLLFAVPAIAATTSSTLAAIILPATPVSGPTASDTTGLLGTSVSLTDTHGTVWTVHGNGCSMQATASCQIYKNSVVDTTTSNVILLVFWQSVIYQEINTGLWWGWNGTTWVFQNTTPPSGWVGISNLTLSSYNFTAPFNGTIGNFTVTLSTGAAYSGTTALSTTGLCAGQGPNNGSFTITGSTPNFSLATNGSLVAGTYINCEIWTQAGLDNSGVGVAWTITGSTPSTALTYASDNATNAAGKPADTFTSFAFPYAVWQGVLSEPERVLVWNTTGNSLGNVAISYSGTYAADFSTAETNCTGTLLNNTFCRVIVNFKPSTAVAETGNNLVVTFTGGQSNLPISGTGTAAGTIVNATCSTFAGNPTLAANTLYLLGDVTCGTGNNQFHTSNGTRVQGDCTAYDGTKTIFDGGNTTSLMTNGIDAADAGDQTANVVFLCFTVQKYLAFASSCAAGSDDNGVGQFQTWDGWLLNNMTLRQSCDAGGGLISTATLRNSHVTANIHQGIHIGTSYASSATGTLFLKGDAFDGNSTSGSTCQSIGECGSFKATNYQHGGGIQDVEVDGGYFNDTVNGQSNQAWCDGCYDMVFTIKGATIIGGAVGGIRYEISEDSSTSRTAADFEHNYIFNNSGLSPQGQLTAACGNRMTVKNNFIDANTASVQAQLIDGIDGTRAGCLSQYNYDFENNIVVFRSTCNGFGAGVCYGSVAFSGSPSIGNVTMKNNTFYVSGPYNTGSAIFRGPDSGSNRTLAQMQAATPTAWETGSTITAGTPAGSPSGCTGDGKYPAGCVGSGQ